MCAVLLFSPSLCIFFFSLVFYFVLSSGFWVDFSGLLGAFRSFFFHSWLSFCLCFAGFLPSVLPWSPGFVFVFPPVLWPLLRTKEMVIKAWRSARWTWAPSGFSLFFLVSSSSVFFFLSSVLPPVFSFSPVRRFFLSFSSPCFFRLGFSFLSPVFPWFLSSLVLWFLLSSPPLCLLDFFPFRSLTVFLFLSPSRALSSSLAL